MSILKTTLKKLLAKWGYYISKFDNTDYFCLESFLYRRLKKTKNFFFIQIGANDGKTYDPLFQFITRHHDKVRGILVEPMGDAFDELIQTYRKYSDILKINVAIHNSEEEMTIYKVDPQKLNRLPKWCKGIASFNEHHHKLSGTPTDCIIPEKVKCISFDKLLDKFKVTKIDLLQIDTEGYDAEIISNINFEKIKPSIIRFEHDLEYGVMNKETFKSVVNFLNQHGYQIIMEKCDATAYQPLLDL